MTLVGGIEAGGTKFVVGIGTAEEGSRVTAKFPTTSPDETIAAALAFFRQHAATLPVSAIGIAGFGPLDLDPASPSYGHILATPKAGWPHVDLRGRIAEGAGVPVGIETDVNAAALAEAAAAGGLSDLAYVTVGTGVGIGLVVNGHPVHGAGHPEMGHVLPRRHPAQQGFDGICPFHGDCLEGLASGPAIKAAWGASLDELGPDHPARDAIADYIAQLCHTLFLAVAPKRIVLGGGVMTGGVLLPAIRARTARLLAGYLADSDVDAMNRRILAPACTEPSGLIGAYLIAQRAR
ncbi:ROK family protein [Sphingomonas sp. AP4-R1]|uniref:ROK family protein n=1 Tax=Sphingomonas sp. AP4-R1 TaxID=2735134 RepID=UPI001493A648|nr:ROK family protein [Sphingomonas sp. AP4-R1]QJU57568.1 ROK family protein [Sphingomonas sp. AP4-R1]